MRPKVTITYNEPTPSRYHALGEEKAVLGVLEEVEGVFQALTGLGYPVSKLPLSPPLGFVREKLEQLRTDVVFNLFEGFDGRPETEAAVAYMLAELGLAYTGCPGHALSLALDKGMTKALLEEAGIPTARYQALAPQTLDRFHLDFPCIVKPQVEDASHGISEESVVHDLDSLAKQVARVSQAYGGSALVEEFLEGREFNITVLGVNELAVLPISEIDYSLPPGLPRLLTFAAKWDTEGDYYHGTEVTCPARIEAELRRQIEGLATSAYRLLGCSGYARVDLRLDERGEPHVLEVNPNPDVSPGTGAARQAAAAGMTYSRFIEGILLLALNGTRLLLGA